MKRADRDIVRRLPIGHIPAGTFTNLISISVAVFLSA